MLREDGGRRGDVYMTVSDDDDDAEEEVTYS